MEGLNVKIMQQTVIPNFKQTDSFTRNSLVLKLLSLDSSYFVVLAKQAPIAGDKLLKVKQNLKFGQPTLTDKQQFLQLADHKTLKSIWFS